MTTSLRRTLALVALAAALLVAAGCDGESRPSLAGGTTAPGGPAATAAPVATDAPTATGATATSVPSAAEDDSSVPGWLVPVGAVLAVLAFAALWFVGRRRGDGDRDTSRQRQAIALAGWIHDQLTLEVLASPPADALRRWDQERNRVDQLTIAARAFAAVEDTEMWDRLVQVLRELSTSIDVALRLRSAPTSDQDLVRESVTIANRHRAELAAWITTAIATI
jgi:hypothetical protein